MLDFNIITHLIIYYLGNVTNLRVEIDTVSSIAALLKCEAMKYDDERVLLGYVLHYIATPHRNVSLYDGRDACGGDG